VGLKDLKRRLTASADELHQSKLQDKYRDVGATAIDAAPLRVPTRVAGEIQSLRVVPRAGSPSLEVSVSDGTGKAVVVFTGRRRIHGLDCGRGVVVEGVARDERGRLVLLNPSYTLLP
jgi:hypothetical protein